MRLSLLVRCPMFSGAAILALTQLGASLAGLLRDRTLAWRFPDLQVTDVYIAAFRPSDFLFQMLVMSAVGTVLVPMLARAGVQKDEHHVGRLLGAAMGMGLLVFGGVAILLAIVLPWIAPMLTNFQGESLELYIAFARIVLISDLLMVIGNVTGQYLITIERYWIYGLTPIVYSLMTVVGTICLTPFIGPYGPVVGTAIGALIYAVWRYGGVTWSGLRFRLQCWHDDIGHMGLKMIPRMVALGSVQIELLVFDAFASKLGHGAVTINAYARNFESVAVGVIGIALAQAVFASISKASAQGDMKRFWRHIRYALFLVILLSIPSSIMLFYLAPVAAWLVALSSVLPVFSLVLGIYTISILFESMSHVLLRGFYALHRTDIPALWNVVNVVSAVGLAKALLPAMGIKALAIGFGVGQGIQMVGLLCSLLYYRRISKLL